MFFVSVFFAPIFASIPSWATGGALVLVGSMMIRKYVLFLCLLCAQGLTEWVLSDSVLEINWDYLGDAVPAFLTLLIIPLSFKYVLLLLVPLYLISV
jgi:AGZA family xanthine/uracil permease-like MFS transporter